MMDEFPLLWKQIMGSTAIQDSHTGELRDYGAVTIESIMTAQALLLLEIVRQSSEIHTGRGKIQDTQYAYAKALILEYFQTTKGDPDTLEEVLGPNKEPTE